ncbi:helix-turn-helix domain-containing protein [Enemella evansiae]|uniref:helix-turn-helix domain-containing protein n=1 Tax=Enemella evansiae TaxID=2016499 RepID=UPI001E54985F|nr:helix-turn-helix domain-containing protein [Enemella evansiae]
MAATPPPYGKGARIVGAARTDLSAALCRRYVAGESIRSMAADVGRSYGFVQALLKEQGIVLRSRGGATRGAEAIARREAVQQQVEQVRAELGDGVPTATIDAPDAVGPEPVKTKKLKGDKSAKPGKKEKSGKKDKKSGKKDKSAKSKKDKKDKKSG